MSGRILTIRPTRDQARFHALECKYPAFCGGFGVGKSETMANQAIMDASSSSDALIGIYQPTYDLIRLIAAPRIEEKLSALGIRYRYNKSENIIYTSNGQFGDFVLRTMDNPARIVGYETYRAHCDEIDTLKQDHAEAAWIKIIARNRQQPKGIDNPFNRVCAYSTPEGFRFMYNTWKKNPKAGYQMVQASTMSNPFLPDDYVDSLRASYPANLIEAYLNGEFVNLTGGQVYRQFDRRLNHSDIEDNGIEALHIGMDFNVGKMSAVIHVERNKLPIAVNEIFGCLDTPDMIAEINRIYPSRKIYVYPDSSGKNRKSNEAGKTDISELKKAGFTVKYKSVNPRVRDRVNSVNAMFCNGANERRYLVNTNLCKRYTDDLEQQVYNKQGEPDKAHDNDHMTDAGGYYIAHEYPSNKPVGKVKFSLGI
jgi:hypothetical protein